MSVEASLLLIVSVMNNQVIFAFSCSEASQVLQPTGGNSVDKPCLYKRQLQKAGTKADCTGSVRACHGAASRQHTPGNTSFSPLMTQLCWSKLGQSRGCILKDFQDLAGQSLG